MSFLPLFEVLYTIAENHSLKIFFYHVKDSEFNPKTKYFTLQFRYGMKWNKLTSQVGCKFALKMHVTLI